MNYLEIKHINYFIKSGVTYDGHFKTSQTFIKAARKVGLHPNVYIFGKQMVTLPFKLKTSQHNNENIIIHILNIDESLSLPTKFLSVFYRMKIYKHVFYPYLYVKNTPMYIALARTQFLNFDFIDKITLCSLLVYQYLISMGIKKDKISFINIPIDDTLFFPSTYLGKRARLKYCIPNESKVILYIGQIEPVRGAFELIRAFINCARILDAILVLASPNTEYEKRFLPYTSRLIKELNIGDRILMIGRVKNPNELYNMADIVVLPFQGPYKITDPPLTVLEALSCGKPVITTAFGTIRGIIKNGLNGFITGPSADEIATRLFNVIKMNNGELNLIKRNARETILKNHSLKVVGERLLKLYFFNDEE